MLVYGLIVAAGWVLILWVALAGLRDVTKTPTPRVPQSHVRRVARPYDWEREE